jgi:hypothetical protein
MRRFSMSLSRLRAATGYKTAYAFYHDNGGKRAFPFTYAYYAKLERGAGLPRAAWLALILRHMRVHGRDQQAALVRDYLRALAADDGAFAELFEPLLRFPEDPAPARALRAMRGRTSRHLTPVQFVAATATFEISECFLLFFATRGKYTLEEVGDVLKRPPEVCARLLKELMKHDLVELQKGGRYAYSGPHPTVPEDGTSREAARTMLKIFRDRAETVCECLDAYVLDRTSLNAVEAQIKAAFDLAAGLSRRSEGPEPEAALYILEARALRPFKHV